MLDTVGVRQVAEYDAILLSADAEEPDSLPGFEVDLF